MSNRDEPPGFDTRVDESWRLHHLENAMERLPLLGDAEIAAEWAGLYEVTPDDQPILGAFRRSTACSPARDSADTG